LGQTRLAIIDVIGGDPPITNEDGSVGVVLNGEIYNFESLQNDLRTAHKLATRCDTEVIAHLAEDLEPVDLARRLHGMFAFAVWDENRRRLVLGRDRLGKKPLYYWAGDGGIVFGSEIKAVLAHPRVPRQLDHDAIPAYLTFGYVPTPRTFFTGVVSLPPGHVLTLDQTGLRQERYWEPQVPRAGGAHTVRLTLDEAAGEVRSRLRSAVEKRLVSDVPLGAFLSGGLDSSAIVATMAEVSSRPVRTFTIGFEDTEGFDERPFARIVAERFSTEHTEFVVKPNAVDLVERLVWHHDQPFGDSSAIPMHVLSEVTRDHVTVALCGDGGDEIFAGYDRFAAALVLDRYRHVPVALRRSVAHAASRMPSGAAQGRGADFLRFLARSGGDVPDALRQWVSFVPDEWRAALVGSSSGWEMDQYAEIWRASAGADILDRLVDLNMRTYLVDDLLPKSDRMSMAHGLEVRSPLLDHELVEFALRLPRSTRMKGMSGKRVLKAAMADVLPTEILNRRKRGFGVPLNRWFRTDLSSYLDMMLGSPTARLRSHVEPVALDALIGEHRTGTANHGNALWTLLTLEVFLRREGW